MDKENVILSIIYIQIFLAIKIKSVIGYKMDEP
jgi:hypothetical protein